MEDPGLWHQDNECSKSPLHVLSQSALNASSSWVSVTMPLDPRSLSNTAKSFSCNLLKDSRVSFTRPLQLSDVLRKRLLNIQRFQPIMNYVTSNLYTEITEIIAESSLLKITTLLIIDAYLLRFDDGIGVSYTPELVIWPSIGLYYSKDLIKFIEITSTKINRYKDHEGIECTSTDRIQVFLTNCADEFKKVTNSF